MVTREAKIVEMVASSMRVNLIDIIDEVETSGNALGTDGFVHILVSKSDELDKYPKYTKLLYTAKLLEIKAGTFTPQTEYEKILKESLEKFSEVPEVDVIHQETVDNYNVVVWTDELMKYTLIEMSKSGGQNGK